MKALGMIEVRGFLGAVSAADAALKAADVDLNNAEVIRGGLTTVELVGDVAAVEAAVEAGVVVAESLNCLISHHVIARLDPQTEIVTTAKKRAPESEPAVVDVAKETTVEKSVSEATEPVEESTAEPVAETPDPVLEAAPKTVQELDAVVVDAPELSKVEAIRKQLLKEKVVNLRKQAYKMDLQHFEKAQIKFANKKTLVDAIMAEIERSDHDWN